MTDEFDERDKAEAEAYAKKFCISWPLDGEEHAQNEEIIEALSSHYLAGLRSERLRHAGLVEALLLYTTGDECWVDGAPDADNSRHRETCGYCMAMAALSKLREPSGGGEL